MEKKINLSRIHKSIEQIRSAANDLISQADEFPAVIRNSKRIMASLKMIEIGVSDLLEYDILDI